MSNVVRRTAAGMTLIEVLVVIAILGMMLPLYGQLFVTATRFSSYILGAIDRMDEAREAQRAFIETVRGASAIAQGVGEYVTGDEVLVLQMHRHGEAERYVVLGMLDGRKRLNLMEVVSDGDNFSASRYMTYRLPLKEVHFTADPLRGMATLDMLPASLSTVKNKTANTRRVTATLRAHNPE